MANITIDGREYDLDKLSAEARQELLKLSAVDGEIRHLQVQIAICQTARSVYATALQEALSKAQA